jgi:hypothetical protein
MLSALLHSVHENKRHFKQLDRLRADDRLLLDRGYPCRWLPAVPDEAAVCGSAPHAIDGKS